MTNLLMCVICMITFVVILFLTVVIYIRGKKEYIAGSGSYIFVMLTVAVWTFFYGIQCIAHSGELKFLCLRLGYIGIALVPVSIILLVEKNLYHKKWNSERVIIASFLWVASYLFFVWGNPDHLYYKTMGIIHMGTPTEAIYVTYGPAFVFYQTAILAMVIYAVTRIVMRLVNNQSPPMQIVLLLVAVSMPVIATILSIAKVTAYDYTNATYLISAVVFYIAFSRFGLFDSGVYIRRNILDMLNDAVFVLAEDKIEYMNAAAEKLVKKSLVDCTGRKMTDLFVGYPDNIADDPRRSTVTILEGETVELSFRSVPIIPKDNEPRGQFIVVGNEAQIKEVESRLDYLRDHDEATGLYNSAKLIRLMEEYDVREKEGLSGTVLCAGSICNLDSLTAVLSREQRKKLESAAARYIAGTAREPNVVTRFGENEFYVFSNGKPIALKEFLPMLEEISKAEVDIDGQSFKVEFKLGVYVIEDGVDTGAALANVAFALRSALNTPEIVVRVYDKFLKLQHSLHTSLLSGTFIPNYGRDFYLEFQPVMNLESGLAVGAEAFVRWNHPAFGKIDPDTFVPMLGTAGYMVDLGYVVLDKALVALKRMQEVLGEDFFVSVNISLQQMEAEEFIPRLAQAVQESGVRPQSLILECKEYQVRMNPQLAKDFSARVQETGVRIAIDEFDWGNSSFAHIVDLKCSQVKLTTSFHTLMTEMEEKVETIKVMIDLCRRFDVGMIPTHIERYIDWRATKDFGFTLAQGFIFSRAMGAEGLIRFCQTTVEKAKGQLLELR